MKIIHLVLGKANPDRMNGVNKVAHQHATHMTLLGHEVTLWGITGNLDQNFPPRIYQTKLFQSLSGRFFLSGALKRAIAGLEPGTVFHIHGALIPEFFLVSRLLRKRGISYIYTPHGAFNRVALHKNRWVKIIYIALIEKIMLRGAVKVHFPGESEFTHMDQVCPLSNKILIPNGQDFRDLEFDYRQLQPQAEPVFGFCGRLDSYYKGLDMLISAFAKYKSHHGNGQLWLIGDGPDRVKLEKQAHELNLGTEVLFTGSLFGQDKLNRIANMHAFFHPSRSEGSPTAVLEACGLGIPCVVSTATNVGSLVDRYQCGIHLTVNDVQHIMEAFFRCQDLFYSGELKPMGQRAAQMVKEQFDWQVIASRLIQAYRTA